MSARDRLATESMSVCDFLSDLDDRWSVLGGDLSKTPDSSRRSRKVLAWSTDGYSTTQRFAGATLHRLVRSIARARSVRVRDALALRTQKSRSQPGSTWPGGRLSSRPDQFRIMIAKEKRRVAAGIIAPWSTSEVSLVEMCTPLYRSDESSSMGRCCVRGGVRRLLCVRSATHRT